MPVIKLFESTHKLDFEIADWWYPGIILFRIGTCHGQWSSDDESYNIISVINEKPGNGHLQDVFDWFENSCKRDDKSLKVLEIMNPRFFTHLIEKRGFVKIDEINAVKHFSTV